MAVKLTALFLLSSISFFAFQGCGGGEEEEEKTTATTSAPAAAVTPSPTPAPVEETTAAPEPLPTCTAYFCDCDEDTCNSDSAPDSCFKTCDELLQEPVMVMQGATSCTALETIFGMSTMCDACTCGAAVEVPPCMKMVNANGVMSDCDEVLAMPDFNANGVTECSHIESSFGGLPVCGGCTCTPAVMPEPDLGYGYGYGYGFGRALTGEEPKLTLDAKLKAKLIKRQ